MDCTVPAEFYALLHRGTPGDLAFYRRNCAEARSVLELGSGFGRVTHALARPGLRRVGLEADPSLLAMALKDADASDRVAGEAAVWIRGDMRNFALGERFDRILIPHSGLYCLLSADDALSCLRAAAAHLQTDGLLIFDGYPADAFHREAMEDNAAEAFEHIVDIEHDGRCWEIFEQTQWHRTQQRLDVRYRYEADGGDDLIEGVVPQRYLLRDEIEILLSEAGFGAWRIEGDFQGALCDDDATAIVVSAGLSP